MAVILVVDDDPGIRDVLAKVAELRGHRAVLAATAATSLEAAISSRPQLAVIDWRLPDGDGLAVLRELRRRIPDLIGIVVTGYPTEFSRSLSALAGAAEYVEKPFHPLALLSRADELLAAPRSPPEDGRFFVPHAARRLAEAIVRLSAHPTDPRTLKEWAAAIAMSRGSLRGCCETIRVKPKDALQFARALRVFRLCASSNLPIHDYLDISDLRTLTRFLGQTHLASTSTGETRTAAEFCRSQEYLHEVVVIEEVVRLLREKS
jgi:CheY-like chemotaxis protein